MPTYTGLRRGDTVLPCMSIPALAFLPVRHSHSAEPFPYCSVQECVSHKLDAACMGFRKMTVSVLRCIVSNVVFFISHITETSNRSNYVDIDYVTVRIILPKNVSLFGVLLCNSTCIYNSNIPYTE
jgi:hypothetical protein